MELEIVDLTKRFGDFKAVDNINLTMTNGVYGLLGVNGAGKTTLMRMLCTLMEPTSGTIYCDGNNIKDLGVNYRKLIGYLPQDYGFYPDLSVMDYMLYIAELKGLRPIVARKRTMQLIEQVGMKKKLYKKMKGLSGGMLRRVGIAQAMLNDPKILILDEPTAGLDPSERIRFRNLISELSENRLVLLSTHIVSDIEYIANTILLMKDGRIVRKGSIADIIQSVDVRAWNVSVSNRYVRELEKKYLVSNVKGNGDSAELRIISGNKPFKNAIADQLNLEDVFLCYFGERGGEDEI